MFQKYFNFIYSRLSCLPPSISLGLSSILSDSYNCTQALSRLYLTELNWTGKYSSIQYCSELYYTLNVKHITAQYCPKLYDTDCLPKFSFLSYFLPLLLGNEKFRRQRKTYVWLIQIMREINYTLIHLIFNTIGVAGAVLQTPLSFINSLIN